MSTNPNISVLELGGTEVRIERASGRKASSALALMRALTKQMPNLQRDLAAFRADYERQNVLELDRVQAKLRQPPRPLVIDGELKTHDDGSPIMLDSPVDRLTEEDWAAAGGIYRMQASPSTYEVIAAVFDQALEAAEDLVYRLLALFTISNEDVARYGREGSLKDRLGERANELLDDSYADELLELAVVVGERIELDFRRKADTLGERMGKALRLIGLEWKSTTTPSSPEEEPPAQEEDEDPASPSSSSNGHSSSRPSSPTTSDEPTDGDPTPPSSSPTPSSPSSPPESPTSMSGQPSPSRTTE